MSFSIDLQTNTSPKNQLTKSVTPIATVQGTLKSGTSIINPVIVMQGVIPITFNYMTISSFGRSYFVTDIKSLRNDIFEISGHCDVLSSFATQIRSNTGIVYRQENQWNLYLNDGVFKVYQNELITTHNFPTGFAATPEFVLAVAGG